MHRPPTLATVAEQPPRHERAACSLRGHGYSGRQGRHAMVELTSLESGPATPSTLGAGPRAHPLMAGASVGAGQPQGYIAGDRRKRPWAGPRSARPGAVQGPHSVAGIAHGDKLGEQSYARRKRSKCHPFGAGAGIRKPSCGAAADRL